MDYTAPAVQMNFLRLLTRQVFQNITYSCYQEDENDCTIQLQGENEMELQSYETTKPKFVNESSRVCSGLHFSQVVLQPWLRP